MATFRGRILDERRKLRDHHRVRRFARALPSPASMRRLSR
jgi:hypothetical protein